MAPRCYWSHADEQTSPAWLDATGLEIQEFVPEGKGGRMA
jgi:hypothetical protein